MCLLNVLAGIQAELCAEIERTLQCMQCKQESPRLQMLHAIEAHPSFLWTRCPPRLDLDEVLSGGKGELLDEDLGSFWGWDSCGPNGLCQSVYKHLKVPEACWVGLLRAPQTTAVMSDHSSSHINVHGLAQMVRMYSNLLDPQLTFSEGVAVPSQDLEQDLQGEPSAADLGGTLDSRGSASGTETTALQNLGTNLGAEPPLSAFQAEGCADVLTGTSSSGPAEAKDTPEGAGVSSCPGTVAPAPLLTTVNGEGGRKSGDAQDGALAGCAEDAVVPEASFGPREEYSHKATAMALMAVWELLAGTMTALAKGAGADEEQKNAIARSVPASDTSCRPCCLMLQSSF